jgi:hypothetical protein
MLQISAELLLVLLLIAFIAGLVWGVTLGRPQI